MLIVYIQKKIVLFQSTLKNKKKGTPTQVFYCKIYESFKNTYFEEHLQTAASAAV